VVLTPRIIGGKLEWRPMLVFIALIIAGDLFGLLGLVLAIPVAETVTKGSHRNRSATTRPTKIYPQRMTTLSDGAFLERADLPTGTYVALLYYR
jgi:hypothetical protein